jgi:hypothetical protein
LESTQLTVSDIGRLFTEGLPQDSDQQVIFEQLARSIKICGSLGSQAWSTTLLKDGFRLNVGNVEALSAHVAHFDQEAARELGMDREHTLVTIRLLLIAPEPPLVAGQLGDGESVDSIKYASVGAQAWCYTGLFISSSSNGADPSRAAVEGHLTQLAPAHQVFVERACRTPTGKLRKRSNYAQRHCQAVIDYAASITAG